MRYRHKSGHGYGHGYGYGTEIDTTKDINMYTYTCRHTHMRGVRVCIYIYVPCIDFTLYAYAPIYIYMYVHTYINTWRERERGRRETDTERERERERHTHTHRDAQTGPTTPVSSPVHHGILKGGGSRKVCNLRFPNTPLYSPRLPEVSQGAIATPLRSPQLKIPMIRTTLKLPQNNSKAALYQQESDTHSQEPQAQFLETALYINPQTTGPALHHIGSYILSVQTGPHFVETVIFRACTLAPNGRPAASGARSAGCRTQRVLEEPRSRNQGPRYLDTDVDADRHTIDIDLDVDIDIGVEKDIDVDIDIDIEVEKAVDIDRDRDVRG